MNSNQRKYSVNFYTSLPETKKSRAEIGRAMRKVRRAFLWANKRCQKNIRSVFNDYPNNHSSHSIRICVNIDQEEVNACGGLFCPEDNEIVINQYVAPIVHQKDPYRINMLNDKKQLRHIVVHELIYYAFTEYEYSGDSEEPICWTVGLCSKESTADYIEKNWEKKWKVDEWLDEILTERLAMHISGWSKTSMLFYEEHVCDNDKQIFQKVKQKLMEGPIELENIIYALYYHDKSIFLDA